MGTAPIIVIAVCVVVLGALAILRGSSALKGEIPKSASILIVVLAVLVAGAILYKVTTASPATAGGDEPQMMMGSEGMGAGGGMGGGMGGPNPHRDLGQLVRKLALFKSQDANVIPAEQSAKLLPVLQALASAEGMTVEEAEAKKAELEALLTPDQTTVLAALELPRPTWGGGAPGGGAGAPGGGMAPPPGGGDRRAAMRTRMLETPYVKKLYDEQVAADPAFATDETKQGEFFRNLRSQLSPFLRGSSQEAIQELIKGLSPAQ